MCKAVIFDWDGTLADTRKVVVASFQKALKEIDCEVGDEFIEQRIGIGSARTFKEILLWKKADFDEKLIKLLSKNKIQNEIELSASIRLFPGSKQLLELLYGRVKLGLASSNDRAVIRKMLRTTNTERFFSAVLTAEDVLNPKPDPEIFLKCAKILKAIPEKCVVVEDSVFGIMAAKRAKMRCAVVLTGVHSRKMLEKLNPDLVLDSLRNSSAFSAFVFS